MLEGQRHFHAQLFSEHIALILSVPRKNQPQLFADDEIPTESYFVLWNGQTALVAWERPADDPITVSGGQIVEDVLGTATAKMLLREQLMARAPGTSLVFPTPEGGQWNRFRFGDRMWRKAIAAAARHNREQSGRESSVYDGFRFHWLRHTAGSLMAVAGLDPAVASERMGHKDGGALFLRTYRHLYEGEKRIQAARLETHVLASLDKEGTSVPGNREEWLNEADSGDGRTWYRTTLQIGYFCRLRAAPGAAPHRPIRALTAALSSAITALTSSTESASSSAGHELVEVALTQVGPGLDAVSSGNLARAPQRLSGVPFGASKVDEHLLAVAHAVTARASAIVRSTSR